MSERDDLTEQHYHEPQRFGAEGLTTIELIKRARERGELNVTPRPYFSNPMQQQVAVFHEGMGQPVGTEPRALPAERVGVRVELLREEFVDELIPALESGNLQETYDAALDILYVTFGLLVEMGLDAGPGFDEVQRSNMSKFDADGKAIISRGIDIDGVYKGRVMKGPRYFKPDLASVILQQQQGIRP